MRHIAHVAPAGHEPHVFGNGPLECAFEILERVETLGIAFERQLEATHHIEHRDIVQAVHAAWNG